MRVRDSGIGIPEEALQRIFDAFEQASASVTRQFGGLGLGLAISKVLVELHHGTIRAESAGPGHGSTFWFTARLMKDAAAHAAAASSEQALVETLRGVRILVVDDNASCRRLVSARLAAWGMLPAAAESGGAALALLREQALAGTPFEVALLDLNLGSMDGFTLAWAIHSQPLLENTRLVLVTALGLENDYTADRSVGIRGTVSKPLKHGPVLQVLAKVVNELDPLAPSTVPLPAAASEPRRTTRVTTLEAPIHPGGKRILLADDNPINRKMALRQLANLGFRADAVTNGREALAALRAQPYGLVLLDVHMPVMDGYETARTIRRLLAGRHEDHITLVALTANRTKGDRQRCLEAGMDDYLAKPVRQDELGRMLARWNAAHPAPAAAVS